jgi:hypothetical protein
MAMKIISQSFAGNSTTLLERCAVCFTVFPLDLSEKPLLEFAVKLKRLLVPARRALWKSEITLAGAGRSPNRG